MAKDEPIRRISTCGLTHQQSLFVSCYLTDNRRNPIAVYKQAYPNASRATASANASSLLRNTRVMAEVLKHDKRIYTELLNRYKVTTERIVDELTRIAFIRMDDICTWGRDGIYLFDSENLDALVKSGLLKITHTETRYGKSISIDLTYKLRALKLLGDWMNMWKGIVKSQYADDLTKLMKSKNDKSDIKLCGSNEFDRIH